MTIALCLFCGSMKFGALNPCEHCRQPATGNYELDIQFSDHYFNQDTLEQFGKVVLSIRHNTSEVVLGNDLFIRYVSKYYPQILTTKYKERYRIKLDEHLYSMKLKRFVIKDSDHIDRLDSPFPLCNMESKLRHKTIKCSCGHEQSYPYFKIVRNIEGSYEIDKVIGGDLFEFQCDACLKNIDLYYEFVYVDLDRKLSAIVLPRMADHKINAVDQSQLNYGDHDSLFSKRVVDSLTRLVEKITIFDRYQTDYEIEIMKLIVQHRNSNCGELIYTGTQSGVFSNKKLVFVDILTSEQYEISIEPQAVKYILSKIKPYTSPNHVVIDPHAIIKMLEKAGCVQKIK